MKWVWQREGWELGNFLMMTPALRLLSKKKGKPIPVFFDTQSVRSLFKRCPFLSILAKKPKRPPFLTSEPPRGSIKNNNVDSFIQACGLKVPDTRPNYYIDDFEYQVNSDKLVAVFHGCLGKYWRDRKRLPKKTLQHVLDSLVSRGFEPVLLGSKSDMAHFWSKVNIPDSVLNMAGKLKLSESVGALNCCKFFISNDSGLYHVASALQKPGLVLWYRTPFNRNKAPFAGIEHFVNKEGHADLYNSAVDKFLEEQWQPSM
jgi:ADP-heptose:LPS heptosyltransferase